MGDEPLRDVGYQDGARFAFTILDDTDDATLENVRPVYELLHSLGMRTTKTVWPLDCPEGSALYHAADTLQQAEYREYMKVLVARGFEIASHGATMESSTRERTLRGLDFIEQTLGVRPTVHCNHAQNRENLYWGAERYRTALIRRPLVALARSRRAPRYEGHVEGSPYFWGDVARERFRFVRNFTFSRLDSGSLPPGAPYALRSTPWVNHWFNTADAPDVRWFTRLVNDAAVDALVARGGTCILSTHLGKGFVRDGRVEPAVERILRRLAEFPGWFATVSEILERQLAQRTSVVLPAIQRWDLEARHLVDRLRVHASADYAWRPA